MNRFRKGIGALILIGSLVAFLPSCKTVKPVLFHNLKPMSYDSLFHKMQTHEARFSSLDAKVSISYKKKGRSVMPFRAHLRIQKDRVIWVSIMPAMGIEAARAELTPDSLKLLNRMKKNYLLGDYHLLDSLLHTAVNYSVMQALLVGNDISGYRTLSSKAETDRYGYLLSFQREKNNTTVKLTQKMWLNPTNFRISRQDLEQKTSDHETKELLVYYENYQNIQGQLLPTRMRIVINSKPKTEIFITFKKIDLDKNYGFPFFIPADYKKLF